MTVTLQSLPVYTGAVTDELRNAVQLLYAGRYTQDGIARKLGIRKSLVAQLLGETRGDELTRGSAVGLLARRLGLRSVAVRLLE